MKPNETELRSMTNDEKKCADDFFLSRFYHQPEPTVNEKIMKLYLEVTADDLLRADLLAEGINTLEAAYVQGFRHGLAELKMRLAEPSNMDKKVSHADYYRQFVTSSIIRMVETQIGIDAIVKSKDEHFNDIPLAKWDSIHVVHGGRGMYSSIANGDKIKAAGDGNSVSTGTCILKQAARMIKESNLAN